MVTGDSSLGVFAAEELLGGGSRRNVSHYPILKKEKRKSSQSEMYQLKGTTGVIRPQGIARKVRKIFKFFKSFLLYQGRCTKFTIRSMTGCFHPSKYVILFVLRYNLSIANFLHKMTVFF